MTEAEAEIQRDILAAYGARRGLRLWRTAVGVVKVGEQWVRFGGPNGHPDIAGVLAPSGKAIYIEVKTATGRLSKEQRAFGNMVRKHGGLWVLARSVADVAAALDPELK